MTSSAPQTTDLADLGYTEAMHLMVAGKLRTVALWRPEAFNRYREAVLGLGSSRGWMERFNRDIRATIGSRCSASFLSPNDEQYPDELRYENGRVAVIRLVVGERSSLIILRADADQVLTPVTRLRSFP